jgi:hypothetical protein
MGGTSVPANGGFRLYIYKHRAKTLNGSKSLVKQNNFFSLPNEAPTIMPVLTLPACQQCHLWHQGPRTGKSGNKE